MREIPLANGRGVAIVDDEDFAHVAAHRWYLAPNGYAVRTTRGEGRRRHVAMHREITDASAGLEIDHVDGDRLNNRRANLRHCSHAENMRNTARNQRGRSGFKGVISRSTSQSFTAEIRVDGCTMYLGSYRCAEDAARAYDVAARQHFGAFARLNFPLPGEAAARG